MWQLLIMLDNSIVKYGLKVSSTNIRSTDVGPKLKNTQVALLYLTGVFGFVRPSKLSIVVTVKQSVFDDAKFCNADFQVLSSLVREYLSKRMCF